LLRDYRRAFYTLLLIFLFLFSNFWGREIRVRIFSPMKLTRIWVQFVGSGTIFASNGIKLSVKRGKICLFSVKNGEIHFELGRRSFSPKRVVLFSKSGFFITNYLIKKRFYSGKLILFSKDGILIPVIGKDVEDFIPSIIFSEAGGNLPPEFLKAFSVVIRSYIFSNLKRHIKEGYNFCSSTHCFFYRGDLKGNVKIKGSLDKVRGLVLKKGKKLISPFFSSCCGGIKFVHLDGKLYFRGFRKIPFCRNSRNFKYRRVIKKKLFYRDLRKVFGGSLCGVEYKIIDGRPFILLFYPSLIKKIPVEKFRRKCFPLFKGKIFLSNFFKIKEGVDDVFVEGRGWGSNCGFCISGAIKMALMGYDFSSILKYYFPQCDISLNK